MTCETQDRIFHDLKLLATLRENDKVYVQDGLLCIHHASTVTSIIRWTRGDNRQKSISVIQNTLFDALTLAEFIIEKILKSFKDSNKRNELGDHIQKSMIVRLYKELQKANVGLRHLRTTYIDDRSTTAKLDVIRERVSERLAAMQKFIEDNSISERYTSSSPNPLYTYGVTSTSAGLFAERVLPTECSSVHEGSEEDLFSRRSQSLSPPRHSGNAPMALTDGFIVFDNYHARVLDISDGEVHRQDL